MVKARQRLSIRRQCALLSLNRTTVYYRPEPTPADDLELMRLMDEEHLRHPFYGSRNLRWWLGQNGHSANRKRVQRLMRLMGIFGVNPKRSTSQPHPRHVKYPYLLRGLDVVRANHVWATDITYVPMAHGFLYLVAIIDWYSRMVLAWRLSNTLDGHFCVDALEDALARWGTPEIFNTDQGVQFTASAFTDVLKGKAVQISMDGRGCWRDNVFVERLWRSLKYEEVYLNAYDDARIARRGIDRYFAFFNDERPHQALGYRVPSEVYLASLPTLLARAA
jgi:putative transposase